MSSGDSRAGKLAAQVEVLTLLFSQFAARFDHVWSVIARGEAGNLLREALERPEDLERVAELRRQLEAELRRLLELV